MNLQSVMALDEQFYMNTFGKRTPVCFDHGSGMTLYDTDGVAYTDLLAGIAVSALGHAHPTLTAALHKQVDKLLHTSSLYYIENQAKLAREIVRHSVADKVFFANSGAEANEGAMKLAKIYFYQKGQPEKQEIITLTNSFHGRTLTCVAATGQEKFQKPFAPSLTPGFTHVPINDMDALNAAVTEKTAAIMVELIQGESGVNPLSQDYVDQVVALCKKKDILLIVDEIQTGMGRTGKYFCYENYGIEPDIFTLAKALGGGVPIGAVCAKDAVCAFSPGDHGTTFGGNPLACAAGLAVFQAMDEEKLLENAANVGAYLQDALKNLQKSYPIIKVVRGMGLLIGVQFSRPIAKDIQKKLFDKKYLIGSVGDSVLRIAPPLIMTKSDADAFLGTLESILKGEKE